jgi:prevent-host-death family protein
MRAVNIKEAKAHLNELIDAAVGGEQVVLMRGSKHVAAIIPVNEAELELVTPLSDLQAQRVWADLAQEQAAGKLRTFAAAEAAVEYLARTPRPRSPGRRPVKRGPSR